VAGAAAVAAQPEIRTRPGAEVGIVSIGGCHAAVREAVDRLAALGVGADYLRVRAFPFAESVHEFVRAHAGAGRRCFVVEQNRDAQLRAMIAIECGVPRDDMTAVLDYGGMPLTAGRVVDAVLAALGRPGVVVPARAGIQAQSPSRAEATV
jgi:2-oxoglutarate ferredoxin oxidoreductase subunit alpha